MSKIFYNSTKTERYELSDKQLASGGEGAVYDIIGCADKVAKIYHEDKRTDTRYNKLKAMTRIPASQLPECAWPHELLFDESGNFCGFIMDKITGLGNLVDFFVYENRSNHTWKQYVIAAINIAAAVNNIHDAGIVIGDLKPDNIIIDPVSGKVRLVDTDSYQLTGENGKLFPCMVATPEYIPPELQNINFEKNTDKHYFNEKTDDFSLAVIIFKILMNGVHPFACFSASNSMNNLESNIRKGCSPYFTETNNDGDLLITLRSPSLDILPESLQELFRKAFVLGIKDPSARPSAEYWFYGLSKLNSELIMCRSNSSHIYYSGLNSCAWCSLESDMEQRKKKFIEMINAREEPFQKHHKPNPTRTERSKQENSSSQPSGSTDNNLRNQKIARNVNQKIARIVVILLILYFIIIPIIVSVMNDDDSYYYCYGMMLGDGVYTAIQENDQIEKDDDICPEKDAANAEKSLNTEN